MATYNSAPFPRRPKESTILSEAKYQIDLAYYRYEVNTGQYVMTPSEKTAYNMIILGFIGMFIFAVYYYLPRTICSGVERLAYYLAGFYRPSFNRVPVAPHLTSEAVVGINEAVASLSDKGIRMLNASAGLAG